ncbi:MAG: purine-nucleoside phosphorylase, partial [Bacteroidia bacterium]|nr:purine-nucleoside phosphorylase [Bacteroidia bacterium]
MLKQARESAAFLNKYLNGPPATGIILGTGLHQLTAEIQVRHVVPYTEIPHFPLSTVETHKGQLLFGSLEGREVIVMQGRFHYYEGYSMQMLGFPVRVMHLLGVHTLLVSNAAGALNPAFRKGELMLLNDHINLQGDNPLIGPNEAFFGVRFPDMSAPYDALLASAALRIAGDKKITLHEGVYAAVQGPMLETRAEYRYLRRIGADAVGMSTVPEIITARHMNMRCLAVSVLTDECDPD